MSRLASMSLPAAIVIIICGLLVRRTDATFYIETHNHGVRLYECNPLRTAASSRTSEASSSSALQLPPSYTTNQDISCTGVGSQIRKREVYATTNFYLVVNPRLDNGRRIILSSPSSELPESIFVGVTIVGEEAADYPALMRYVDVGTLGRLRDQCEETLPSRVLPANTNLERLVEYMATFDFYQFAYLTDSTGSGFSAFSEIVRRVQSQYSYRVSHGRQNGVSSSDRRQTRSDLQSAVGLLIQKVIDPCLLMSNIDANEAISRDGRILRPYQAAEYVCTDYCLFLKAVSNLHSDAASCGLELGDGTCEDSVCKCHKRNRAFGCTSGPSEVTMIKCSNDIRVSLVGSVDMGV